MSPEIANRSVGYVLHCSLAIHQYFTDTFVPGKVAAIYDNSTMFVLPKEELKDGYKECFMNLLEELMIDIYSE